MKRSLWEKLKASEPKDDIERFRKFYYVKKASFARGSSTFSPGSTGNEISVDHLWRVKQRLQGASVGAGDAARLIARYDSLRTFFYLDPPYPNRAFVGAKTGYTEADLAKLVSLLKGIKGKFMLSLGVEHTKLLPQNWHIKKLKVRRNMAFGDTVWNKGYQYEIIATNYNPNHVLMSHPSVPFLGRRRNGRKPAPRRATAGLVGVRR